MTMQIIFTYIVFISTMIVIFWRPKGINEAWPATIGAVLILVMGIVSSTDLLDIIDKVGGASVTIISTIVMAVILESFGFFHWAAIRLASFSKQSGYRLYWNIQLLCFLMTLLFNNDGSILITTPILLLLLKHLQLKTEQQILYLLSGALIATASSAPIGVSNIVNLIALKIVDLSLWMHTAMMFVPATIGLLFMSILMFVVMRKKLPRTLPDTVYIEKVFEEKYIKKLHRRNLFTSNKDRTFFMLKILFFVFCMRCMLFIASYINVPIELVAVLGSIVLLVWRWIKLGITPWDIIKKTPWHILVFAFSMYIIIYGLHNVGLTELLVSWSEPIVNQGLLSASILMGGIVSFLSNIFNNHPALMIGTITLTEMGIDPITLKTIYLANIIGSDIGALLLPIGTLASLIWFSILRKHGIEIKWRDYTNISFKVIPLTTIVTLFLLYFWIKLVFH
ncbi:arsenic transporter [Sporosarcina ureae]|nr:MULTISPECIES: arsenic transporter [Sporosarcina]ARJ37956.1 arsenic transporter [Sporosarcina ureae]PIC83723.1 arsenic transporter [Sporosarcina sp. P1]